MMFVSKTSRTVFVSEMRISKAKPAGTLDIVGRITLWALKISRK